ncbi:hypothetical protein [Desulfobacca acetoxidans]|uniref:Uncharacterized protein n=1 Tax=Desulfobacca acetoxidans (strain ATCC 700848 / DSM 11109 / ASRB2) TaxID=880072 RepID=F2NIT6_DESAR|nr:hypothetical protein [Desulfobacca acetoxidans]AEB10630.1 hypothetical protein Desac_2829 [Desulfobacca acetoxidans DSM 11109]HAY21386.1 hypothetical protein [Desulfobacterales bacterium]
MQVRIGWIFTLAVVVGLASVAIGWAYNGGQGPGSGGWEFFSSPTGGPVGLMWGGYKNEMRLEREAAAAKHNYCPTGGCVVRLEKLAIFPKRVQRGRTAYIDLAYTILTASDIGIPVTISREIFFQGKSLGKTFSKNLRTPNGSFSQEVSFVMPDNSAPGVYSLKTQVITGYGQDEKTIDFTVE